MPTFNPASGQTGTVQSYTVLASGKHRIEASGGRGGPNGATLGGLGAVIAGDIDLTVGQVIKIVVAHMGVQTGGSAAGGGGGSFVWVDGQTVPLIVAGGGGGTVGSVVGTAASTTQTSSTPTGSTSTSTGGAAGSTDNASGGAGGCGWNASAVNSSSAGGGIFSRATTTPGQGGNGGTCAAVGGPGGFGGGGGGEWCSQGSSGGGGGYSGGWSGGGQSQSAGGGGSFVQGLNQSVAATNTSHGLVVITALNSAPTKPTGLVSAITTLAQPVSLAWTHNDPDGNPQAQYQIRYRKADV